MEANRPFTKWLNVGMQLPVYHHLNASYQHQVAYPVLLFRVPVGGFFFFEVFVINWNEIREGYCGLWTRQTMDLMYD